MHNPDIIISQLGTEKGINGNSNGVYVFKVLKSATKTQIKSEIEHHFGVKVVNINTLNTKSKARRVGRYAGKTKTFKKAYVTLAQGNSIEV
jgi:large subunit ribosomal protein L23